MDYCLDALIAQWESDAEEMKELAIKLATYGAINDVKHQPTIEPRRGKWIYGEDEYGIDGYHCNQCGFFVPWDYAHMFINYIEDYHYCPNCGADMREGGEDEQTDRR